MTFFLHGKYRCITMVIVEVFVMETPKLQITSKKYTEESTVISMRLPRDMLRKIDEVAGVTGRTRNEILQLGMEFALSHMELCGEKEKE